METSVEAAAAGSAPSNVPESLPEQQLRQEYEDAEIQRFLHIFSTYVLEVKSKEIQESNPDARPPADPSSTWNFLVKSGTAIDQEGLVEDGLTVPEASETPSISEYIAKHYVAPRLPLQQHEIGPFSLSRARLTLNRLYIVAQIHLPHLRALMDLALWTNFERSLGHCIVFWILWWYNFLLPSLVGYALYGVLRRGVIPYPTVQDLREHRSRIMQADEFSATLSSRITQSSTLDVKELWRLIQLARVDWVSKFKPSEKKSSKTTRSEKGQSSNATDQGDDGQRDTRTSTDDSGDLSIIHDIPDLKRYTLHILTEFVDLHERLRNISIWRSPAASKRYSFVLLAGFLVTWLVPAQLLAKGTYAAIGMVYWHGIPLLCAMASADRKRIPMPFSDVPTDAEYAMQLISERVARGEDVEALIKDKNPKPHKEHPATLPSEPCAAPPRGAKKLKAIGKIVGDQSVRLVHGHAPRLAEHPLWNGALSILSPSSAPQVYTYSAQRGSTPGLITLASNRLLFTPFVSSHLKTDIDVQSVSGVKKSGMFRGIQISYRHPETRAETEEKFHWVNNRDELFARLVAGGQQSWQNV